MRDPLTNHISALRGRMLRQALMAGVCLTLAMFVGAALGIGTIDYLISFEDPGVQIMATLGVGLVLVWSIGRFLIAPLSRRPSDIALAQQAEKRNPRLADQLSSAVAFSQLAEDELGAGSPLLRRAVIASATAATSMIDWSHIIPRRPLHRSFVLLVFTAGILVTVLLTSPKIAQTAAWRLVDPLGNHPWPRVHYLVVQNTPTRIAAGSALVIEATDLYGRLPEEATIHYRVLQDGAWEEESVPMQRFEKNFIARKDNVTHPLEFRVTGGDDFSMAWRPVAVVEPPKVRALTVTLYPPPYTGYPAYPSERHIRALEGTCISFEGESTAPIQAARLVLAKDDSTLSTIDATIAERGSRFEIGRDAWKAEKTASYWFELEDRNGLIGGAEDPMSLRIFADTPPAIAFELPPHDLYGTPDARVPCTIVVKDDLAIRNVDLVYSLANGAEAESGPVVFQRIPLFQGPDQVVSKPNHSDLTRDPGDRQIVEYFWDLAPLELSVGTEVRLYAEASDYRPQVSRTSTPRKISIISHAELENRLGDQQSLILAELEQACNLQRTAHDQTRSLGIQIAKVEQIGTSDRDTLHTIELAQQQVTRLVADPKSSVQRRITALLAEMENNCIHNQETAGHLADLRDELERLGRDHLPVIIRQLTTAIKAAEAPESTRVAGGMEMSGVDLSMQFPLDEITSAVTAAEKEQKQVLETLERLVSGLRDRAGYRQFARDFAQLLVEQEQLIQQSRDLIANTVLSARLEDLTRQQQADLQKAARHQLELARRMDALGPPIVRAVEQYAGRESDAAQTLADGLALVRDRQIAGRMREASQNINNNQIGRALEHQKQIATDLCELIDILRNQSENGPSRLVNQLREAERDLALLRERARGLRKKINTDTPDTKEMAETDDAEHENSRQIEQLKREQETFVEDIDRMARRLKRLTAHRASRTVNQAAERLATGMQDLRPGQSREEKIPTQYLDDVVQDLDKAQEQLAEARRQAEQDLAREQLVQLETIIQSLVERQVYVLTEIERLQALLEATGHRSFEQLGDVHNLANEEALLRDETTEHGKSVGGIGVIQFALKNASTSMDTAASRLAHQETDSSTQEAARAALIQLQQLQMALTEDLEKGNGNQNNQFTNGGGEGGQQENCDPALELTELKLLRRLQQDIHNRTIAVEKKRKPGEKNTADRESQLAMHQISQEQKALAQLILDLTDRKTAIPGQNHSSEDPKDDLPDLDRELEMDLEKKDRSILPDNIEGIQFHSQLVAPKQNQIHSNDPTSVDHKRAHELGEDLGAKGATGLDSNLIFHIGERMQKAGRLIGEGNLFGEASHLQEEIIHDLDRLIESFKSSQCKSSSNGGQNRQNNGSDPSDETKNSSSQQTSSRSNQSAKDSTDPLNQPTSQKVNMAEMHHLMKGLWGHLPERTREQMLQSRPETFLPEYELEIEQYYRRLSEDTELIE
ncbi:MAG: hypothetical protein JW829_15920 [Pirellulales bacterium]|nr:hypothetical protein [Pirellulales bacterium]